MIKQVTVEKVQFQASDGSLFDDEHGANLQNKRLVYINAPIEPRLEQYRESWGKRNRNPTLVNPIVIYQYRDYQGNEIHSPKKMKIISDIGWLQASMVALSNFNIPTYRKDLNQFGKRLSLDKDHIIKTNDEMAAFGFMNKYLLREEPDDMTVYG